MEVNAMERAQLMSVLPMQGRAAFLRRVRKIVDKLKFEDDEIRGLGLIRVNDGRLRFPSEMPPEAGLKDVDFKPAEMKMLVDGLESAEKHGVLTLQMLPLYEKFVGEPTEEDDTVEANVGKPGVPPPGS